MIRAGLVGLVLIASSGSVTGESCPPIDGLDPLLQPGTVLILGELHGTVESPAFVADVACHAARAELPVVVGLELLPREQQRVDRFLASEGTKEEREALLAGPVWQAAYQDGRASQAMFGLLESLRKLRTDKPSVKVTLFDAPVSLGGQGRERGMAKNLERAIAGNPGAFVIALAGNLHSRTTVGSPRNRDYEPMAYLVDRATEARVVALNVAHGGGSAWICAPSCGVIELAGRHGERKWSIEIDEQTRPAGHQGWYHVGRITASPPAKSPDLEVSRPTTERAPQREVSPPESPAPGEDPKIAGSWQAHDFSSMAKTWKMEFEGSNFRADGGGDDWYVGEITVHPDKDPAWIDFRIDDCRCSFKDTTSRGIYFWDGESMIISAPRPGNARPGRFVESSGQMMRLIRREE